MSDPLGESAPDLLTAAADEVRSVADLAKVLRQLRRREARRREGAELTYRQLAGRAGWSHAVVAVYLTGKTLPPTDRFDTLVQLLGASPAEQSALATARDRVEESRRVVPGVPSLTGRLRPHQLPADLPGFTGRGPELAELDRLLAPHRGAAVGTAAVTGTAGVGKTALAIHWAHRAKPRFPYGQLYTDLRGYGPEPPAAPERVLDGYLAAFGVAPAELPADLDAKVGLYRSLLARRRVLVVLDNAADPRQVRPLLPTAPGSAAVVTSRTMLTGLVARDRAHRIVVDVLPVPDAVALLAEFVGTARVAAEPVAARRLARLCDCLPVALCALGERAAAAPPRTLAQLAYEFATAGNRLDLLEMGDDGQTTVRTVLDWSYHRLPPPAARLFRLLGRHPEPGVDRATAAGLCGVEEREAGRLIDILVTANLLRRERADRYRLPDLLRLYAAELARRHGDPPPGPPASDAPVAVESLTPR